MVYRILKWRYFGLCVLVLIILGLHFSTIMRPPELVFDEKHYVVEARRIMLGWGPIWILHPPFGKLFIIFGIQLFGDNPFGWRVFSILFGAVSIILFYFICGSLNMPRRAQLLATYLFGFENLSFTQSSLAVLDVYSVTFMLSAFLLYLKMKHIASGVCVGLGALAKLPGALAFPAIFLDWLFTGIRRVRRLMLLAFSAVISFLVFYPLLHFATSRTLASPFDLLREGLRQGGSLTFHSGYHEGASRPWDWLLGPQALFYNFDPQYIAMVTPTIWILIIPSVIYMIAKATKGSRASLFGLSWFAGTYLIWIAVSLVTDRVTYMYYFYPTVGAICIGIGLGLNQLLELWGKPGQKSLRRMTIVVVSGYLAVHLALFLILSPVLPPLVRWLPIP